jgi:hypothetical protein
MAAARSSSISSSWHCPPCCWPRASHRTGGPAVGKIDDHAFAGTAEDLHSVYQKLGSRLQIRTRETELTALLASVAAILMLAASSLSVLWFGRIAWLPTAWVNTATRLTALER